MDESDLPAALYDRATSRRRFIQIVGASALVVAIPAACSSDDDPSSSGETAGSGVADTGDTSDATGSDNSDTGGNRSDASDVEVPGPDQRLSAALFAPLAVCALTPQQTAGPFPLDEQFDRSDITEGYPGHPLRVGMRVVDEDCEPVPGAVVEIWHADASGDYSAFTDGGGGKDEAEGTTFMRGSQAVDDEGIADFTTIWPGWYSGRAVHIHVRVRVDDELVLITQVYFDDDETLEVFATGEYAQFGAPDTTNARDGIAGDPAADGTLLTTWAAQTANGSGTLALVNLGVGDEPIAAGSAGGPGAGGPGGPGPGMGGPGGPGEPGANR